MTKVVWRFLVQLSPCDWFHLMTAFLFVLWNQSSRKSVKKKKKTPLEAMTKSGLQGFVHNLGWVMRRPKTPSDTHTQKKPWTTKSFYINCIKISTNIRISLKQCVMCAHFQMVQSYFYSCGVFCSRISTFPIYRRTPELWGEVQTGEGLPRRPVLPGGSVFFHGGWPDEC